MAWPCVRELLAMPDFPPKAAHAVLQKVCIVLAMLQKAFRKLLKHCKNGGGNPENSVCSFGEKGKCGQKFPHVGSGQRCLISNGRKTVKATMKVVAGLQSTERWRWLGLGQW